jgi:DNA-binding transcriptional LysR family regulator
MSDIDIIKLRRLDFSLLLVFREIMRQGRSTAAAERLGLSQPAISHALGRLRDLTEDPLFLRRPNGLQPTPLALQIAPNIDALIQLAGETLGSDRKFDPAASDRLFRIAANDFAGSLLMAPLIADFAVRAPSARLSFRFAIGPVGFNGLRDSELDVVIGRFDSLPEGLIGTTLFEDGYSVIARAGHPSLKSGLDLERYLALGHLLVSFSGDLTGTVDKSLKQRGLTRRIVAGSPMFLNAFAAVAESDLIATTPTRLAKRFAPAFGLRMHTPPLAIDPVVMELVRTRTSLGDPTIDWLANRIAAAFA